MSRGQPHRKIFSQAKQGFNQKTQKVTTASHKEQIFYTEGKKTGARLQRV